MTETHTTGGKGMRGNNFLYLFAGLLIFLLTEPVLHSAFPDREFPLMQLAFTLLLVVGVWSLADSRRLFRLGVGLVVVGTATAVAAARLDTPAAQLANLVVVVVFCVISIVLGMRVVLGGTAITANHLMGAASVYLLLGTLWAVFYVGCEIAGRSWFHGLGTDPSFAEFLYLSFVTLTTLGYGDIIPIHPIARACAYLEAVTGQLYMAVLVAGLVGRHVASKG